MIDFRTEVDLIEASLFIETIDKESEREYASDYLNYLLGNRKPPTTKRRQNQRGLAELRARIHTILHVD